MAVEMHASLGSLPEKFEKLRFYQTSVTTNMPSTTSQDDYTVEHIVPHHHEPVLDHLRATFFHDEPLNIAIRLLDGRDTCEALEDFCIHSLKSGASLVAIGTAGEIIGVCVNSIDRRDDKIAADGGSTCNDKRFQKIINLLDAIEEKIDIFAKYPDTNSIINCKILSVDNKYRGKGIATALLDKSRAIGREQGCKLMRVDCTSHYSARAIAKLGFEQIFKMEYAEYRDKDTNEVVFKPAPPHNQVEVYVQKI